MSWASAIYNHHRSHHEVPPLVETTEPELAEPGDELFAIDLLLLERANFLRDSQEEEHLDLMASGNQPNWYLKWLSDNLPRAGVFRLEQGAANWRYQQEKGEAALRAALRHPNCPVNFFGALARRTDHDLLQAMSLHLNSPLEIDDPEEVLLQAITTPPAGSSVPLEHDQDAGGKDLLDRVSSIQKYRRTNLQLRMKPVSVHYTESRS